MLGKKIQVEKNVGSKKCWVKQSLRILGSREFWVQKYLGSKRILGPKKCWVHKTFGSNKILGPNKFCVQKQILGPKKSWDRKMFGSQIIFVPKNIQVYENLGSKMIQSLKTILCTKKFEAPKDFGSKNIWVQKKFLSKKCWGKKNFRTKCGSKKHPVCYSNTSIASY